MRYTVPPGLYAVGTPQADSDVFVSANYKLSFDVLRRALNGMDGWILVLDTGGINVWCAAGKGTFGTEELVCGAAGVRLDRVVRHRRLILPQLGAPGIQAHVVKQKTGFRVHFGPVDAADLPAYVQAGYRATREMRTVRFSLRDRLVLTPMEINSVVRRSPWFILGILLFFGLRPEGVLFREAWQDGRAFLILAGVAALAGALLTPMLLPWVPGRSFGIKGWIVGLLAVVPVMAAIEIPAHGKSLFLAVSLLLFPAISSYLGLQFTGATTFTSQSGVARELKVAVPLYIGVATAAAMMMVAYKATQWGLL
jgi:hypothetical protein